MLIKSVTSGTDIEISQKPSCKSKRRAVCFCPAQQNEMLISNHRYRT